MTDYDNFDLLMVEMFLNSVGIILIHDFDWHRWRSVILGCPGLLLKRRTTTKPPREAAGQSNGTVNLFLVNTNEPWFYRAY